QVEVICRRAVTWLNFEKFACVGGTFSALKKRLRAPGGIGPFPLDWLAETPGTVRLLPDSLRRPFTKRCLRPAAAGWLLPRMDAVNVHTGRVVAEVHPENDAL